MSDRLDDLRPNQYDEPGAAARAGAMTPKRHMRHRDWPTKGACGAGYDWPTSIALTDRLDQVTCENCLAALRMGPSSAPPPEQTATLPALLREAREYVGNVYVLTRNDADRTVANEAADLMRRIDAALVLFG